MQSSGTLIVVPAYGEVRHPNDEARATFMVEEQDKDRVVAVNRVNQRMKQGTEIIRNEDKTARLETRGYFTFPVYSDEGMQPPQPRAQQQRPLQRQIVGWRVGQYLEVRTTNLEALPRTVAAAQKVLALNGLQFGLADETNRKLEEQRIAAAYENLMERMTAIAKAMGRNVGDMILDTVDFEGSGGYVPQPEVAATRMMSAKAMDAAVVEPGFEPGETTLTMRVVGRARLK
ncbi:MAG TPA: SIMPL domain-containing protein [Noviherbaspirillum sp.]|nr:SIMPL domain-containing protein [Noviherbaspirillum sp.]